MKKINIQDKRTLSIAILSMAVVLLLVLLAAVVFTNFGKSGQQGTSVVTQTVKTERSLTGKSTIEDKHAALDAAQELLNASNSYKGDLTVEERLKKIDAGDYSVADVDGMKRRIRFAGEFADDKQLQHTTLQALITLASHLKNAKGKVEPVDDTMFNYVFLDGELGNAFVPVSAFTTAGSVFSLEMVYIDGKWKLAPYSLLDVVRLSSNIAAQLPDSE